jgi:hypothetical protein
VEPKLRVGQPDDAAEREADRVAEALVQQPEPAPPGALPRASPELLRRAPRTNVPAVQDQDSSARPEQEGEQTLARKPLHAAAQREELDRAAGQVVADRDAGQPLASTTLAFFEPRLGADLGGVRLHRGPAAAAAAARLDARAFTYGTDIWLGAGEREGDRRLLGHELTHVLQSPGAARTLRRYVRTNTIYLWDVYEAAGQDAVAVSDDALRDTIEYEDYRRPDLTWQFSDTVALAALRRSMELFAAGVRGRGPNYIRSGREAEAAAHGVDSIALTELGFTGDHLIASVPGGLGTARGGNVDDPDGSTPVWTAGSQDHLVSYTLGTAPTMFARFAVAPAVAAPVPNVQVRATVNGTVIGQAAGLTIAGDRIEDAAGGGRVTGIGGGAPIPGASVGGNEPQFQFETSTDGGRIWLRSGSARVRLIHTAAAPAPPGGALREDVLDWGGLMIGSAATLAEDLRRLVQVLVSYDPSIGMPLSFTTSDDVMTAFTVAHQCDSQAYLLRYLALSFGVPAEVRYFWMGTPTQRWVYNMTLSFGHPNFQCDRPAEDMAAHHPHFSFHALTEIGGVLHDAAYDATGLPGILEQAPGASPQTAPRAAYLATATKIKSFTCPH